MVQLQHDTVHNHTAAMMEIGTNLLIHTAEQTRKLTSVEAQVNVRYKRGNLNLSQSPCELDLNFKSSQLSSDA